MNGIGEMTPELLFLFQQYHRVLPFNETNLKFARVNVIIIYLISFCAMNVYTSVRTGLKLVYFNRLRFEEISCRASRQ